MTLGSVCEKRGPGAEIWDAKGKSHIVDLSAHWKQLSYSTTILPGAGDELFALADAWSPILHYHDGTFTPIARLEKPTQNVFVSAEGKLHAYDGQTFFRYEGSAWIPIGALVKPTVVSAVAVDGNGTMLAGTSYPNKIHKVHAHPDKRITPEPCKAPFVYLYDVKWNNAADYTFPTTRKALSTFPEASAIHLQDYTDGGRKLGVVVTSKAQAEAVIAHVKATMKDEDPRYFCYTPNGRSIPIEDAPKGPSR
ncbi:Hypothetical protein A7982_06501 [Minicystis rosea]|nr:Hypothetical protein A7982_06501 [Minicystis rosea]